MDNIGEIKINTELKQYIEKNIFPNYEKNDLGHNLEHIKYVIDRSLKFARTCDKINYDMVYTIAAYHDIGHHIDATNHEKISSEILQNDTNLKKFFNEEQIKIMADAVYDHRASLETEPRSIYGKIVSSADRNTNIDVILKRTYEYRIKHNPEYNLEQIIEESRQHIIDKFGKKGYATEKMYFEDIQYKNFLEEVHILAENIDVFRKRYIEVNNLNRKMELDRIKHSYSVALKMQEIGKKLNLTEEQINELFILGFNHDIGYQFIKENESHSKVGGELLKQSNYKYWEEVYYHGEIDVNYSSLYLDILNLADMQIDKEGNDVGFYKRLLDIRERYGEESTVYKKCYTLTKRLKDKYHY